MKKAMQKRTIARVEVQRSFCENCGLRIRQELLKIQDVSNVVVYPQSALVVFSFFRANELSQVLNVLTELGYPEVGEDPTTGYFSPVLGCSCTPVENAA